MTDPKWQAIIDQAEKKTEKLIDEQAEDLLQLAGKSADAGAMAGALIGIRTLIDEMYVALSKEIEELKK